MYFLLQNLIERKQGITERHAIEADYQGLRPTVITYVVIEIFQLNEIPI